jgi:hypothetical protein
MDFPAARVKNGQNGTVPLTWAASGLEEVLLSPLDALLMTYEVKRFLNAPVTAGEQVGTVYVRAGNRVLWSIPIVTAGTDEKQDYRYMFWKLMKWVGI